MREFLETTSAVEVREYMALNMIDPLFDRVETAVASLTCLISNIHRGENDDPTSPQDWIPDYTKMYRAKTVDELSDEFDEWYAEQQRKGVIV